MLVIWLLLSLGMCEQTADPDYFTVLSWGQTSVLMIYLYSPGVKRLRREPTPWFMPVALIYVAIMPIFTLYIAALLNIAEGTPVDIAMEDPGVLYIWHILPLLYISTQYRIRIMFLFILSTAFLSVVVGLSLYQIGGIPFRITGDTTLLRVILFSIVGYVLARITQSMREQSADLARKNTELAHYATTLEQLAITRERNRMARELHDTLAHTLSAVNIQLKALEVQIDSDLPGAKETVLRTQQLTRDGLHESRRALQALRSSALDEFGCVLAIQQTAKAKAERSGIALHLDLPIQITGFSPQAEQNLFRIVEEAVNNIIKHAQAKTMWISLYQEAHTLDLCIRDDGIGFQPDKVQKNGHYGLVGMQERALLLNGELSIQSEPGTGTIIQLQMEKIA